MRNDIIKDNILKIATRNSELAIIQANIVKNILLSYFPHLEVIIIPIASTGDKLLNIDLNKVGGKGLFTRELEIALKEQHVDIAVHSCKDIPAIMANDFIISVILKRDSPGDVFVSNKYSALDEMPNNLVVGTSSIRRQAFLKKYYPHLNIKFLRGNVGTRLKKLDINDYDGIILAASGLIRLNLQSRIREFLDISKFIPTIGQGALAIQILKARESELSFLNVLNHDDTKNAIFIEREIGKSIGATCATPVAIHASINNGNIYIRGILFKDNGTYNEFYLSGILQNKQQLIADAISILKV